MNLFNDYLSGATFSDCKNHRFELWRIWDFDKPFVMFIGLNPSTANQTQNDPTISCVYKFAKSWGYGGFYMMNLYSVISSNPEKIFECEDPLLNNDQYLDQVSKICKDVVFAWGKFKQASQSRIDEIINKYPNALCITKRDGVPVHPLWAGMWAPKQMKEAFFQSPIKFHQ